MRYYCNNCNGEFKFGNTEIRTVWEIDDHCPVCGNDDPDKILIPIPDFETPAQYEKRTGKKLSSNAAVWFKPNRPVDFFWGICRYESAKRDKDKIIVVCKSPEPPPDDWQPEAGE